jgi:carbon monoxide dehydrogenase subunit G
MQSETTVEIAAQPEAVYDYLADFMKHSEWSKGVSEVEQLTPGPVAPGSEFRTIETVPAKFTSFARITALERPRTIAWESWDDGGMMRALWSFELEPAGPGTRLTQRCAFQPQKLIGTLALKVIRRWMIPGENRASLARVKALLEGDGAPKA